MTKAIRELEAEVDAQLVLRSSRGIEFTESGRQLTVRARLAHQQLELARQDIRILQGSQHGRVAVAVTPMVFLGVLPEVVRAFRKAMPQAQLKLFDGLIPQVLPLLREGAVDFAVAGPVASALDADFAFERLDMIEMAVLCRRGHPLRHATRWEEIAGAEWLMHLAPAASTASCSSSTPRRGCRCPSTASRSPPRRELGPPDAQRRADGRPGRHAHDAAL